MGQLIVRYSTQSRIAKIMRVSQLLLPALARADITFYTAANGDVISIDAGCPTLWPKNTDKNTVLPYWYKECPPMELCYPGVTLNSAVKPFNKRCKDANGDKWNDASCCTDGWNRLSLCYGYCLGTRATNLDGKSKVNWKTSGQKQADFNAQPGALGVDGKILSAGWIHKANENTQDYYLILSFQGIELTREQIMVWNYDLYDLYSEPFGHNQWYTFAQTMIVLKPNAMSPQGPFTTGDVTNVLIGIENVGDLNQANIDAGVVAYSVGYLDGKGTTWDFSCITSHFGVNPPKNDMAISDLIPSA